MTSKSEVDSILNQIITTHEVDANQVAKLEGFVNSDWIVDQDETELLFKVNQAIAGNDEGCPEWSSFFVNTVTKMIVLDMETPGEIDAKEGDWIGGLFEQYSVGNLTEASLCEELKKTTSKIEGKIADRL
ncbi:MAG: hypothetical protein AB8B50_08510 [Pirellulaceae bacterium]